MIIQVNKIIIKVWGGTCWCTHLQNEPGILQPDIWWWFPLSQEVLLLTCFTPTFRWRLMGYSFKTVHTCTCLKSLSGLTLDRVMGGRINICNEGRFFTFMDVQFWPCAYADTVTHPSRVRRNVFFWKWEDLFSRNLKFNTFE